MTVTAPLQQRTGALPLHAIALAVLGCCALALRTVSGASLAATAVVGLAAVVIEDEPRTRGVIGPVVAVAVGIAILAAGRRLGSPVGIAMDGTGLAGVAVAGVAQEAFFRRFLYGRLMRFGVAAAVCWSGVAFAAVHIPIYGLGAMPIDLAAGLLFGWQRWATGSWHAPAATHGAANVFQAVWVG